MRAAGAFVGPRARGDARRRGRRRQPARARRARPRHDPRRGCRELLHRLPPVVRRLAVRQGHLHLGQRRRAARAAARLRAAGWRPAVARLRRVGRRLGRRLGALDRRRHRRPGRLEADGCDLPRPRCRHRRRRGRQQDRRHLGRDRRRRARRGLSPSTPTSAATASGASCMATPTSRTTAARKRGLPLRAGLVFAIEPWFMLGTDEIYTDADGWTLRSRGRFARRALRAHDRRHRRRPDRAQRAASARRDSEPRASTSRGRGSPRSTRPARARSRAAGTTRTSVPNPEPMPRRRRRSASGRTSEASTSSSDDQRFDAEHHVLGDRQAIAPPEVAPGR